MITRYWLDCVKIVDTMRWPKARTGVVDRADADAESCGAVAVNDHRRTAHCPPGCWSHRRTPAVCSVAPPAAASGGQRGRVGRLQGKLILVRLTVASSVRSCTGCMYSVMPATRRSHPATGGHLGGARAALAARLRLIRKRPLLRVTLLPSTPMKRKDWRRPYRAGWPRQCLLAIAIAA